MNLNLLDPKFIMLAAVVILVIAVSRLGVCAKAQEYDRRPAEEIWARVRSGSAEAWVRTKSRSEIRGSREAGRKAQHS